MCVMDNKKWTDADLLIAFEDACKFINFIDLQDFLLKRRQLADTIERQLTIPVVSKSVYAKCGCGGDMIPTDSGLVCNICG